MDNLGDQICGGFYRHILVGEVAFDILDIGINLAFGEIIVSAMLNRIRRLFFACERGVQVAIGVAANEAGPCVWSCH